MIRKIAAFIGLLLLLVGTLDVRGQDPHFSQFYANPLYLNPAFTGTAVCPRLIMNYRNQWPSIPGSYVTYNAGFDMQFDALSGGLGIIATSDRAGEGVLTHNTVNLLYSYQLKVSKSFSLRAGFEGGFFQKSVDITRLTFPSQIHPRWGIVLEDNSIERTTKSTSGLDFSTGVLGFSENFYMGIAAHHLTQPNESLMDEYSEMPMKLSVHTGGLINLRRGGSKKRRPDDPILSPNFVFLKQGEYHQLNYGVYLNKMPMIVGIWYRHFLEGSDAVIMLAGFQYDQFKFAYSYDITISKLSAASGGAHEFSFGLMFNCPEKRRRLRDINCPSF